MLVKPITKSLMNKYYNDYHLDISFMKIGGNVWQNILLSWAYHLIRT